VSAADAELATSRERDAARGRRLEILTLGWNLVEAAVAIGAGVVASSVALLGFGIDSVIESVSGGVLLWRLQPGADEARERRALALVGASFLLLAAYVAVDAIHGLIARAPTERSPVGIAIAALSLVVMPILARAKRCVAARLGSRALVADSRQTDVCAWLSAILLGGLAANAWLGWWWADAAAALAMVPILVHEGLEGLRVEHCDDC